MPVLAQELVRDEARLVRHRRAAGDEVAEVDVGDAAAAGVVEQVEDVPGPQGAVALVRVVVEVDRGQAAGEAVDVADADEAVADGVAPLLGGEGGLDEGAGAALVVRGGALRP